MKNMKNMKALKQNIFLSNEHRPQIHIRERQQKTPLLQLRQKNLCTVQGQPDRGLFAGTVRTVRQGNKMLLPPEPLQRRLQ
jgi:hypothetical protein